MIIPHAPHKIMPERLDIQILPILVKRDLSHANTQDHENNSRNNKEQAKKNYVFTPVMDNRICHLNEWSSKYSKSAKKKKDAACFHNTMPAVHLVITFGDENSPSNHRQKS